MKLTLNLFKPSVAFVIYLSNRRHFAVFAVSGLWVRTKQTSFPQKNLFSTMSAPNCFPRTISMPAQFTLVTGKNNRRCHSRHLCV